MSGESDTLWLPDTLAEFYPDLSQPAAKPSRSWADRMAPTPVLACLLLEIDGLDGELMYAR